MDRRKFFKIAGVSALGSVTAMGIYPFLEAKWCRLARRTITLPNLPPMFRGMTLAFISDVHHGPFVPLAYVREIVEIANSLEPDLVLLTGDYVSRHPRYIEPGIEALGKLKARIGRFAVLGNHDHWEGAPAVRHALAEAGISLTDNMGFWLDRQGDRLRICGVGDLWTDRRRHRPVRLPAGDGSSHRAEEEERRGCHASSRQDHFVPLYRQVRVRPPCTRSR